MENAYIARERAHLSSFEYVDDSDPDFGPMTVGPGCCRECGYRMWSAATFTCFPRMCRWKQRVAVKRWNRVSQDEPLTSIAEHVSAAEAAAEAYEGYGKPIPAPLQRFLADVADERSQP